MLVTYAYYKSEYGGQDIPEANWLKYEKKAETNLDRITRGAAAKSKNDARVLDCICSMAETIAKIEGRRGISSETNDGWSVTYTEHQLSSHLAGIAAEYLANTGLLYAGGLAW